MGERLDIFEERMQQIQFDDIQDDEFVAVTTVKSSAANPAAENGGSDNGTSSPSTNGHETTEDEDSKSPTKQQDPADSMRTEDLDEESAEDVQPPEEQ